MSEVMQALQLSQTSASRNLTALYNAGLLNSRRVGPWVLYAVDEQGLDGHSRELLSALQGMLSTNRLARQDIVRLDKAKRLDA